MSRGVGLARVMRVRVTELCERSFARCKVPLLKKEEEDAAADTTQTHTAESHHLRLGF